MLDFEDQYYNKMDKENRKHSYSNKPKEKFLKHGTKKSKECSRSKSRDKKFDYTPEKMTDRKLQLKSMRQWAFWEDYIDRLYRFDEAFYEIVKEDEVDLNHTGEFVAASLKAMERV